MSFVRSGCSAHSLAWTPPGTSQGTQESATPAASATEVKASGPRGVLVKVKADKDGVEVETGKDGVKVQANSADEEDGDEGVQVSTGEDGTEVKAGGGVTVKTGKGGTQVNVGGMKVTGSRWADNEASFYVHETCPPGGDGRVINCSNNNEIYSFHPGGANFLYADGSVHFHAETMDAETFVSLFTMAAGDIPGR